MSNRRRPRRQLPRDEITAVVGPCPDCNSEFGEIWTDSLGVHHLPVLHDDTCPRLASMERRAGGGR